MPRKQTALELAGALGHVPADKRVEILRRVGEVGSISQAARGAGVSYKAAWQALDTLSNLAGAALVQRSVGGAGGGGALLTEAGAQLLRAADELAQARDAALSRLSQGPAPVLQLSALALRTSMRNQLPCEVRALRGGGGVVRVELALADGQPLASRVTRESAQLLALRAGQPVLALFKATAVAIARQARAAEGRNRLYGRIGRASRAAAGGEFALALGAGLQLVGFAGAGNGLKLRDEAVACVDESAVVVALAG
jgi:molybdate transport system regulatory protein